jgi:hypothetical protein
MLGRKTYTQAEFDDGKATIEAAVGAYARLAEATADGPNGPRAALAGFEPHFFNGLVLVLDRLYVHRVRLVTGKDLNALNEVELLSESLLNHGGAFHAGTVVRYAPERAVLHLAEGDRIALTRAAFEQLAAAFFAELKARFLDR